MNDHNDMKPSHGPDPDAHSLEYEAAAMLVDALSKPDRLHLPGARERHRHRLGRAIDLAQAALEAADRVGATPETIAGARATFVRAHAARAQDARHGAGQLSRGCQRAPTREACDDGWQRVESIVAVAETSASEAERVLLEQEDDTLRNAAGIAEVAARVHRVLQGLRADIADVCRVNAYFSADLDTETVARTQAQLGSVFADYAPSYHAAILPMPLPADQGLQVEVIALSGTDGSRLERTSAEETASGRWPNQLPYAQAVRCGDTVFVSSQLPLNGDGGVTHPGDIAAQTHQVMDHMLSALGSMGADFSHMTKVNAYFEGHENLADWSVNVGIRSGYYVKPGPASTGIEVSRLSASGALISADCIAVID